MRQDSFYGSPHTRSTLHSIFTVGIDTMQCRYVWKTDELPSRAFAARCALSTRTCTPTETQAASTVILGVCCCARARHTRTHVHELRPEACVTSQALQTNSIGSASLGTRLCSVGFKHGLPLPLGRRAELELAVLATIEIVARQAVSRPRGEDSGLDALRLRARTRGQATRSMRGWARKANTPGGQGRAALGCRVTPV
jgi:hypothetical protein